MFQKVVILVFTALASSFLWWRSRFKICRRCRSRIRRWASVCHVCGAEQDRSGPANHIKRVSSDSSLGTWRSRGSHNDDRPSKFIVVAVNMKSVIKIAWEHGGADFQLRFDKSTAQAE